MKKSSRRKAGEERGNMSIFIPPNHSSSFRVLKSSKEKEKTSTRSKSLTTIRNAGTKILNMATEKIKKAKK